MILVDSSVWIDFFRGEATPQVERLDALLGNEPLAIGDLILAEVLQGFVTERDFNEARKTLDAFTLIELGGKDIAVRAAKNYRILRGMGLLSERQSTRSLRHAVSRADIRSCTPIAISMRS